MGILPIKCMYTNQIYRKKWCQGQRKSFEHFSGSNKKTINSLGFTLRASNLRNGSNYNEREVFIKYHSFFYTGNPQTLNFRGKLDTIV